MNRAAPSEFAPAPERLHGQARRLAEPPIGVVVIARRLLDGAVLRLLHRLRQRDAARAPPRSDSPSAGHGR